ncbi:hypothetical protein FAGKG844_430002 [Frankia sp. AgKG'84/4]
MHSVKNLESRLTGCLGTLGQKNQGDRKILKDAVYEELFFLNHPYQLPLVPAIYHERVVAEQPVGFLDAHSTWRDAHRPPIAGQP